MKTDSFKLATPVPSAARRRERRLAQAATPPFSLLLLLTLTLLGTRICNATWYLGCRTNVPWIAVDKAPSADTECDKKKDKGCSGVLPEVVVPDYGEDQGAGPTRSGTGGNSRPSLIADDPWHKKEVAALVAQRRDVPLEWHIIHEKWSISGPD